MANEKIIPDPLFEVGDILCAEYIDLSGNPQKISGKCVAVEWNNANAQHIYQIAPTGFYGLIMKFPERGSWQTASFPIYRNMNIQPENNPGNPSNVTAKQAKKR